MIESITKPSDMDKIILADEEIENDNPNAVSKLYVSNEYQKILFLSELVGQISDGEWENASPSHHWEFWSFLSRDPNNIIVTGSLSDVGIYITYKDLNNFAYKYRMNDIKRNYNFTSRSLLNIVGPRMIATINAYILYKDKIDINAFYDGRVMSAVEGESYYEEAMTRVGFTKEMVDEIRNSTKYDMKNLIFDLNNLKTAFKTDRKA